MLPFCLEDFGLSASRESSPINGYAIVFLFCAMSLVRN